MARRRSKPTAGFRSKLEKEVADKLQSLKITYEYETIKLPYVLEKKYVSDFSFDNVLLEVKGVLMYPDREKMVAVKRAHPDLEIIFCFQAPHRKVPNLKMTHAEWAEKYGFKWTTLQDLEDVKPKKKRRVKSESSPIS